MLAAMSRRSDAALVPLTLVVGGEELLADRAVTYVMSAVRAADPDADVRDLGPGMLEPGMLGELTSPSLFGERKCIVIRAAHDLGADVVAELSRYVADPAETVALVVVHAGGVKGKAILDALAGYGTVPSRGWARKNWYMDRLALGP